MPVPVSPLLRSYKPAFERCGSDGNVV